MEMRPPTRQTHEQVASERISAEPVAHARGARAQIEVLILVGIAAEQGAKNTGDREHDQGDTAEDRNFVFRKAVPSVTPKRGALFELHGFFGNGFGR